MDNPLRVRFRIRFLNAGIRMHICSEYEYEYGNGKNIRHISEYIFEYTEYI